MALYQELDGQPGQGDDLPGLAVVQTDVGHVRRVIGGYSRAAHDLEAALAMFHEVDPRGNEAYASNLYAAAFLATGDLTRALEIYREAPDLRRKSSSPTTKQSSWKGIVQCLLRVGENRDGTIRLQQAREIFRRLGMRPTSSGSKRALPNSALSLPRSSSKLVKLLAGIH